MNFSAWSIRNPIAPILAFFLLVVVGIQSFNALPITRFPNIDVPLVAITVGQSGASPAELKARSRRKSKTRSPRSPASTKSIRPSPMASPRRSSCSAWKCHRTGGPGRQGRDRPIRGDLPASVDEPIVSKIDVEGQAIQSFAVSSPNMNLAELSWFVDDTIKRALQGQPGIGRVDRYGGADREVRVELIRTASTPSVSPHRIFPAS